MKIDCQRYGLDATATINQEEGVDAHHVELLLLLGAREVLCQDAPWRECEQLAISINHALEALVLQAHEEANAEHVLRSLPQTMEVAE